jgi:hypothetical protein
MATGSSPHRPWVLGIRPKRIDWFRHVQALLLSTFHTDVSGGATAAAEAGLGLPPSCYWYIFRTEAHFGHIVFLWTEKTAFRPGDGAVAPFDTGGIWHGHVMMDPVLDSDGKARFVASNSAPVSGWRGAFEKWILANYESMAEYVAGTPPKVGVPGIVYDSRNSAVSWTWEARLEKKSYRQQVAIRHVFWNADDRKAFEDWVEVRSGLDEKVAEDLLALVDLVSIESLRTERANEEVVRHLLRIVEDE